MVEPTREGDRRPGLLERIAQRVTLWSGGDWAFAGACGAVILWILSGPFFDYSSAWQLVINTGTTIITFLMVFLIQRSQNKESRALQLKLNEIVSAIEGASNRMIGAEEMSEKELEDLADHYRAVAEQLDPAEEESQLRSAGPPGKRQPAES
jgi:low affinity Fe/Cu permease